jgi:hypothetical protein
MWVGAGYPVFIAAVVALWFAYRGEVNNARIAARNAELMLLEEKDRRVRELEAFQKIIEERLRKGGLRDPKPF